MKRVAPTGPVEATVDGLAWSLAPRDNKVDFDIWYKARLDEAEERRFLAAHLRAGDVFVDVGANIGLYTLALLSAVEGVLAVTFEPLDALRERQRINLAINGLAHRARVRSEAVGPYGTMTLYEGRNAGRASLVPFAGARAVRHVTVRPLRSLLDRPPRAIKIDVEGFEDQALLPYFDELAPAWWPRAVVIETLHRAAWRRNCLCELASRGYLIELQTDENALLVRRDPY